MDFSNLFRHFCHSLWFDFPTYTLHTSTFLPPFAPHPLRCFFATMEALTPDTVTPSIRYPWFMHLAFLPFRLQPPIAPYHRFSTLPLSLIGFLLPFFSSKVWASPFPSRLTVTTGRIEFVVLRTSFSPPVAPHHTSQCRSYVRLQVWKAFYLKGTSTPMALRTFRRTRGRFQTCPYIEIS